jgi:hypothetical protein
VRYLTVYASAPIESSVGAFVFVITCDAECSLVGAEILKLLDLPRERIAPKLARRRLPL